MGVIQVCSIVGLAVSLYALYVEHQSAINLEYSALCDVQSLGISCSKVFSSEYGRIMYHFGLVSRSSPLNLPNAAYGAAFYVAAFLHEYVTFVPHRRYLMAFVSAFTVALSLYLGYVLFAILKDVCIVCLSTYVLNGIIFIASVVNLSRSSKKTKNA